MSFVSYKASYNGQEPRLSANKILLTDTITKTDTIAKPTPTTKMNARNWSVLVEYRLLYIGW
jgi:hypothetical protein